MSASYPMPCDPLTGVPWWMVNLLFCFDERWRIWQRGRLMDQIIPVLRWLAHGAISERNAA